MAGSSSTMATRRFMGGKATGCAREVKALESCHFAPQFFAAASLLRPRTQPPAVAQCFRSHSTGDLHDLAVTAPARHPPRDARQLARTADAAGARHRLAYIRVTFDAHTAVTGDVP